MSEDVFFTQVKAADAPALEHVLGGGESSLDALVGAGMPSTGIVAESADLVDVSEAAEVLRRIATALNAEATAG